MTDFTHHETGARRGCTWQLVVLTGAALVILIYLVTHFLWPTSNRLVGH